MSANPNAPYDERVPPGPRGRRRPPRWGRPAGTLEQRLARARMVFLLDRARGVGDWIALCLCLVAVGVILVVLGRPIGVMEMLGPWRRATWSRSRRRRLRAGTGSSGWRFWPVVTRRRRAPGFLSPPCAGRTSRPGR